MSQVTQTPCRCYTTAVAPGVPARRKRVLCRHGPRRVGRVVPQRGRWARGWECTSTCSCHWSGRVADTEEVPRHTEG